MDERQALFRCCDSTTPLILCYPEIIREYIVASHSLRMSFKFFVLLLIRIRVVVGGAVFFE